MESSKSSVAAAAATKTIYFTISGRNEVAIFREDTPSEDIKALFRSAAEAGPHDIVKMYTAQGSLVNISSRLDSNQADSAYRLQVVGAHYNGKLVDQVGSALTALEERMCDLERKVHRHTSWFPPAVEDLRVQVNSLRKSLATVTTGHRNDSTFQNSVGRPYWNRSKGRPKTEAEKQQVCDKFMRICEMTLSDEIRRCLRMPSFNNWQWEDEEILLLLQQMYLDLDFPAKFCIQMPALRRFLCQVYINYNEVPFHNFQHCFCVSQMMYGIIWCLKLPERIGDLETLILLTSCICHDLDHPGFNNIYQINARTELALRYNDISPLENHHCSVAFRILEEAGANIFASLGADTYKKVREGIIRCILATDMARHNEILNQFHETIAVFDYANRAHINLLCMVLIKVADISNEARPLDIAEPWLDCLLQEFFEQSDAEKLLGLPVTPFMDRDKITKPSSQCSFIGFVLLPLFESIGQLFPELESLIVNPVREALEYYRQLNEASKDTRSRRSLEPPSSSPVPSTADHFLQPADSSPSRSPTAASIVDDNDRGDPSRKSSLEGAARHPSFSHSTNPSSPRSGLFSDRPVRVLSTDEELRRVSLGLDPYTTTEVEVSEKTLIFKIATESRPSHSNSVTRRASLALTPSDFNISGFQSRVHCAVSQPASPRYVRASIVEEEEHDVDDLHRRKVPLKNGCIEDSALPAGSSAPESSAPEPSEVQTPAAAVGGGAADKTRSASFFARFRHWKEKLSPVHQEKRSCRTDLEDSATYPDSRQGSPRLGSSRKTVPQSLTRFFRRSFTNRTKNQLDLAQDSRPVSATPPFTGPKCEQQRKMSGSLDSLTQPH